MNLVADASFVISLARVDRLNYLFKTWPGTIFVPQLVADEVLVKPSTPDEQIALEQFLKKCKIVSPKTSPSGPSALSRADRSLLQAAREIHASLAFVDEKALRHALLVEGIHVMGTLGVLITFAQQKLLTRDEVKNDVNQLMTRWNFRISATTYKAFLDLLGS